VVLAYGGLDHVVVTAGHYPSPDEQGSVADPEWAKTFAINVMGPFLVADEAWRVWQAQGAGLEGSLVITTSVNAVVPKAGSFAYDTSKAAANHLVRELAVAFAPLVRVRSEEHTSELQSRGHLVCRLLLEKKKTSTDRATCWRTISRKTQRSFCLPCTR